MNIIRISPEFEIAQYGFAHFLMSVWPDCQNILLNSYPKGSEDYGFHPGTGRYFKWHRGAVLNRSIITGMAAKEIVVSSMGVLYHASLNAKEKSQSLKDKLQEQTFTLGPKVGQKVFSPLVAFGLMIFVLIYFPCVAVVAAIKKEANWRWALFTSAYTTAIAWVAAFAIFQIGSLFI